jgi:hypothetical protein
LPNRRRFRSLDDPRVFNTIAWVNPQWIIDWPTIGDMPEEYSSSQATLGTNGAANGHLYRESDGFWVDSAEAFGREHSYFAMSVQTVPEPSGVSLLGLGMLGILRFGSTNGRR